MPVPVRWQASIRAPCPSRSDRARGVDRTRRAAESRSVAEGRAGAASGATSVAPGAVSVARTPARRRLQDVAEACMRLPDEDLGPLTLHACETGARVRIGVVDGGPEALVVGIHPEHRAGVERGQLDHVAPAFPDAGLELRLLEELEVPTASPVADADHTNAFVESIQEGLEQSHRVLAVVDHPPDPQAMVESLEEIRHLAGVEPGCERSH